MGINQKISIQLNKLTSMSCIILISVFVSNMVYIDIKVGFGRLFSFIHMNLTLSSNWISFLKKLVTISVGMLHRYVNETLNVKPLQLSINQN